MIRKGILFCLFYLLTACAVAPKSITITERYAEATQDVHDLFNNQACVNRQVDFYEALARGLKYNIEFRVKLVNTAIQLGQLDMAIFTLFPAMNLSGSLYNRSNKYATFGITSTGQPTDVLTSTPNTIRSARAALSWNILDFGMSYIKARQQGDRMYIAVEESRRQLQQLAQDILIAYWNAYSAQQVMLEVKDFQALLAQAKTRIDRAMLDKSIPQESILNYQSALLEGNRRLLQLQYRYDRAMIDLKHFMNVPVDVQFTLAPLPLALRKPQNLLHLDFKKLDTITLVNRPELRGQSYQERIAKLGVKTAILQALPGITLNEGWNYNSNKFLLNNIWIDRSVDVAWNLLNLASLPVSYETAKAQVKYEKLREMALTLTALTQTRYSYSRYVALEKEYTIAHKQTQNAYAIYRLNKNRQLASLASDQQVILAKLKLIASHMDEDLVLSDLSTALGELYLSAGIDLIPCNIANQPLGVVRHLISENFMLSNTWDFNEYVNITYHKIFHILVCSGMRPC